jgi:predicted nucleotidyltransferase
MNVQTRKQQLQNELDRILPIIRDQYQPEKVIAYGSFAHGTTHEWSDLDIAIVKKTNRKFLDRLQDVMMLTRSKISTEFVVYTPEEFQIMARDNYFIRDEIIKKGTLLYDKNATN